MTMQAKLTASISEILDAQEIENGAFETPVRGLRVLRTFGRVAPRHMNYRPSLCVIAQGAKHTLVGYKTITYGAMQTLVVTVDVPVLSQITEASPEKPFLGATLNLNPDIIRDVVTQLDGANYGQGNPGFGLVVNDMDSQ